jgi:uncharacterized protein YqeY
MSLQERVMTEMKAAMRAKDAGKAGGIACH